MRLSCLYVLLLAVLPQTALSEVFGDPADREPIADFAPTSTIARTARAVGRLDLLFKDGNTGFCTAFLIGGGRLMTASFCVPDENDDRGGLEAAQFVADYVETGSEKGVERFAVDPSVLAVNADVGFAILAISGTPSDTHGKLALSDAKPGAGTPLWLIGHPLGQAKHISRQGCNVADPAAPDGLLAHRCDTLAGDGGAPLIDPENGQAVALHFSTDRTQRINRAVPMWRILDAAPDLSEPVTRVSSREAVLALLDALLSSESEALEATLERLAVDAADPEIRRKAEQVAGTLSNKPDGTD